MRLVFATLALVRLPRRTVAAAFGRKLLGGAAVAGALIAVPAQAQFGLSAADVVQHLRATYYDCRKAGQCSPHKRTASGAPFNPTAMACAMRKPMPLGAYVRVTYRGRSAVCRVNDRGPAARTGNGIDLTPAMRDAIGLPGVGHVTVQRVN
jgi:rare lipoprotein A (peptidoglycan hydrolase)